MILERKLSRARHIFLCADFDGTIVPIKPRPKEASLCANIRRLLGKISKCESFTVAVISGRSLKDIREKVGVKGLIFAGNHGLEIAYKKKKFIYPAAKRYVPLISKIGQKLAKELIRFPEAVLEQKRLSLSLHYRLVKKGKLARLRKIFLQITRPYLVASKIKLTYGKKVWEVRPPIEWDKGKAVLWLLRRLKQKKVFTIYIGDDLTDEDAFLAVNKIGGASILVGRRKASLARHYLRSTKDTQKFLEHIYRKRCRE